MRPANFEETPVGHWPFRHQISLIIMLRQLEYACLVGCIALIGSDRIDLLLGRGPFRITPFVVLAPLFLFLHLANMAIAGRFSFAVTPAIRRQIPFLRLLIIFLFLAALATIFGMDPERGLMAFADLALVSLMCYFIALRLLVEPSPDKLIVRSISIGLFVYLVFCTGEYIAWNHGVIQGFDDHGSWLESMFAAKTLFWMPRVSGATIDANRSGFILVTYLVLLDLFAPKARYRKALGFTIGIFISLTLSRSAILCWLVYWLVSKTSSIQFNWKAAAWAGSLIVVATLLGFEYERQMGNFLDAWQVSDILSDRISGEAGTSGGDHLALIQRGFDTWSSTGHRVLAGIGLASAPKVLGDFFGDDKYGNFHCLFVTVLAELGLPALLVLLVLLLYPLIARVGAAASIAAVVVFNVPYQSHMEPAFWLVLALVWSFRRRVLSPLQSFPSRAAVADEQLQTCYDLKRLSST
jgi:hypothetical protein